MKIKHLVRFALAFAAINAIIVMAEDVDYQYAQGGLSPQRIHWQQATQGRENLALGKPVAFSPAPDDPLTTDANDPYDLTDGKLTAREDDRLWFEKDAVGWQHASNGANLQIDLGEVQPVGQVAVRFLGGAEQGGLLYPNQVSIVGSEDGVHYYTLAARRKLLPAEKELAEQHPESYFFFPEAGVAATETFVFDIHRKARFIGLRVMPDGGWFFTDQIAVLKDQNPAQAASLEGLPSAQFIIKGIAIVPRQEEMVITTNIPTPNYFLFYDARKDKAEEVRFFLDLPDCLNVAPSRGSASAGNPNKEGVRRWVVEGFYDPRKAAEPYSSMYITLKAGQKLPDNAKAVLSSNDPDSRDNVIETPLRAVEIPAVPTIDRLVVSMTWMQELIGWARNPKEPRIPDVYAAFKQMGFNTVPTFPRYFTQAEEPILRKMIADARSQGMRIDYNESPFHTMTTRHADKPEIYNQVEGKQGKYVCPSYTGPYYQEDIQDAARFARIVRPEQVDHDIELWYYPSEEAEHCSRCQEGFKASGLKTFDEYLQAQGTRMMHDLYNATAGTAPDGGNPLVGLYNVHATTGVYERVYNFDQIYPRYIQLSEPSLYVQNRPQLVHDVIRANYQKLQTNAIIPWLTTGTYGEFPSRYLEPIILESFLNGSRGIGYFMFLDFDPMDFVVHADTLRMIAPYQALIADGKPVEVEGSNAQLTLSAWGNDKEALVLAGNYSRTPDENLSLNFKGKQPEKVLEVKDQKQLTAEDLQSLKIAPDTHRLLYVTFK